MMKVFDVKRIVSLSVVSLCALTMSACSTTSSVKVASGAPITYKIDQNSVKMASVTRPSLPRVSSVPDGRPAYTIPSPYEPQGLPAPRPQVTVPAPSTVASVPFDPSTVDRDLYKHQRVGKRYTIMGQSYTPKHEPNYDKVGEASWYGDKFHGKPTATGEIYNKNDMTAAHKTLPLNSMLHVTNLDNGRSIMVRLNDRGPFVGDRIIDLSEAAARTLGTVEQGVGRVRVRYVGPADPMAPSRMVEAPRPQPVPQPTPRAVPPSQPEAQTAPQGYQPLRRQQAPEAQAYTPPAAPQAVPEMPREYAPYQPAPQPVAPKTAEPQFVPQAVPQPSAPNGDADDDGVVTLTIKGPIHMASSKSEKKAEWIPAVNYTHTRK